MIGFDAIGQIAIGELAASSDVIIFMPVAASVVVTTALPVVTAGASVAVPVGSVVVITPVAAMFAGSLVTVPSADVSVTTLAAAVQISATVTAPGTMVSVTTAVPIIGAGAIITAPAAVVIVLAPVAFVTAGVSIELATSAVVVTAPSAGISISATVTVPVVIITTVTTPAQILGGNYIEASNTVTTTALYGEIASAAIGHFAIGEGEPTTITNKRGPFVIVSTGTPLVTAGKSVFTPVAANINVTTERAEIDSRGRKLRVLAIAS